MSTCFARFCSFLLNMHAGWTWQSRWEGTWSLFSASDTLSSTWILCEVESVIVKLMRFQISSLLNPLMVLRMARTVSFSWAKFSLVSDAKERVGKS